MVYVKIGLLLSYMDLSRDGMREKLIFEWIEELGEKKGKEKKKKS